MKVEEMNKRIQQFVESWGEELNPWERAPAPLTRWLRSFDWNVNSEVVTL